MKSTTPTSAVDDFNGPELSQLILLQIVLPHPVPKRAASDAQPARGTGDVASTPFEGLDDLSSLMLSHLLHELW